MERSLKVTLAWLTIGAVAIGVTAAVALVGIASMLHIVSRDLGIAVESVYAADRVETLLLAHHEATTPVAKAAAKAGLLSALETLPRYVQSDEEGRRVADLSDRIDTYFQPGASDSQVAEALTAAHRVSLVNVDQARQFQKRANLWDHAANVGGTMAAIAYIVGLAAFIVWLRRGPLRTVAMASQAMDRFHGGDLDARAPEQGPRELVAMARSFNTAAEALVRARQRQAEYVATAIHDLRTPLTAIQLAIGYFEPGRSLPPESRTRELITLIERQLTRISGLTGDILNATWIEEGQLLLLRVQLDVRALAAAAVQLFRSLAPEHMIDLDVPPEPLIYYGDQERLAQVLNNLLSNAVKYSPAGSRVRVQLTATTDEISVAVTDEGPGIAPELRGRVFETFRRQSATHEEAAGTSLGLWVSRRVVEAHGGRMELDSHVGRGSTFRVVLPVEDFPTAHPPVETAPGATPLTTGA